MTWETKVVRLEDTYDVAIHERIRAANDGHMVDGWLPIGVMSSLRSEGLYLIYDRPIKEPA